MNFFRNFMQGRYGPDALTYTLIFAAAIIMYIPFMQIPAFLLLAYSLYRVFSKNTVKRYTELQAFNKATYGIRQWFRKIFAKAAAKSAAASMRLQQMKTYVFLKCPGCKNRLRLPRGKGKLQVTCPVCRKQFYKKT